MDIIIIFFGVIFASALTVPAGFGLSTMLTPIALLFMSPHEAVTVVAIVHVIHNGAKYISLRDYVDFKAVKHYGVWLIIGSILGAVLNNNVSQKPLLAVIGICLVILPILTLSERWTNYKIPEANDRIGGFGSGFMGGLSGHQGALRAMFLTRRLRDKMNYAATASILALCVDLSRIPVYLFFRYDDIMEYLELTIILVIAALIGVNIGKRWLESMKNIWVHNLVMSGIISSGIFYLFQSLK
ncbi:MAG: hypothetical protein CND89_00495 [Marine Group II euryarchaeote MED-G38]|nr:hypothetical protein [Euryarchaeota archaeon]OUV25614.1 MAG: hypothetical protein CBC57_04725 [Euryarchaeota archaeon TMED97]PDH23839.1 MAG: hypothetical protein CND89_00495 [Marine Group II euryarchaeote MED-G38]|tara:strand:+ start:12492 stop:13217 length:726 start_codon:yes stop_codon:yes gene_type:complete